MKSELCQWLTDLQKIASKDGVIVEAQHFDVLEYYFKSPISLEEAYELYKKFRIRYEALTSESQVQKLGIPVKTEAVPRLDLAILEEKASILDTINKAVAKLYDDAHEANKLHSLEFSTIGEKVAKILGYLEE
ncbi:MAG: hypothetical protein V4581_16710 [Bacteroidota bacterium]